MEKNRVKTSIEENWAGRYEWEGKNGESIISGKIEEKEINEDERQEGK